MRGNHGHIVDCIVVDCIVVEQQRKAVLVMVLQSAATAVAQLISVKMLLFDRSHHVFNRRRAKHDGRMGCSLHIRRVRRDG